MASARGLLLPAVLLLGACARPVSAPSALKSIAGESHTLLRATTLAETPQAVAEIPRPNWPRVIASVNPERLIVRKEGLYISTGSFFVEEWGYFVPRDARGFHLRDGSDPAYASLGQGVFRFRLSG